VLRGAYAPLFYPFPPLPDISGRGVHPEGFSLKGIKGVRFAKKLATHQLTVGQYSNKVDILFR
jgi:hypothetical protein